MAKDKRLNLRLDDETFKEMERFASLKNLNFSDAIRELISSRSLDIDEMKDQLTRHEKLIGQLITLFTNQSKIIEAINTQSAENKELTLKVFRRVVRLVRIQQCDVLTNDALQDKIKEMYPDIIDKPSVF